MKRFLVLTLLVLCCVGCGTTVPSATIQPQINGLIVARKYDYANRLLSQNSLAYGDKNRLLYYLDKGIVAHYSQRYADSIHAFERAKAIEQSLYAVSITNELSTWLINDVQSPFRPEDFESTLIHFFQALNYAALGQIDSALVEARQVHSKIKLINANYAQGFRNTYQLDPFIYMIMGILFEKRGAFNDLNDAMLFYEQAIKVYEQDFFDEYGVGAPEMLYENYWSLLAELDPQKYQSIRKQKNIEFSYRDRLKKSEVYAIVYHNSAPLKVQTPFVVPVNNYLLKVPFPGVRQRRDRPFGCGLDYLADQVENKPRFEEVYPIDEVIVENIENRKGRVTAKVLGRQVLKYAIAESLGQAAGRKWGSDAEYGVKILASLFNIASEQVDLRSWQTLPGQIHMAKLVFEPGTYSLSIGDQEGEVMLQAGEKRFLIFPFACE